MTDDAIAIRPLGQSSAGPAARLIAKPVALHTLHENVVILARDGTAFRPERLAGLRPDGGQPIGRGIEHAPDRLQIAS